MFEPIKRPGDVWVHLAQHPTLSVCHTYGPDFEPYDGPTGDVGDVLSAVFLGESTDDLARACVKCLRVQERIG